MPKVYADYAAGAPIMPEVLDAMLPYFGASYGNPSAAYDLGIEARRAVEDARGIIAESIGANPDEIVFVSSGCEADSTIIRGVLSRNPGGRFVTDTVEHKTVQEAARWLSGHGWLVDRLTVDQFGRTSPAALSEALRSCPAALVSIMYGNNETGVLNDVADLARIAHEYSVLFHSDCVQAYQKIPIDVKALDLDAASFSGHKIGAPSGIGFLYLREGIEIDPLIFGSQEGYRRGGTENVAYIVGLAKAVEIRSRNLEERVAKTAENQRRLIDGLRGIGRLNGPEPGPDRLANNVSFCFGGVQGEELLELLNLNGIAASTGSACNTSDGEPSHVLLAIGLTPEEANSTIRFTVSEDLSPADVDYIIAKTKEAVALLRRD